METLIPDFQGKWENLKRIIDVAPEIGSHNLETVRRLTKEVRIQAKYDRSLEVLKRLKEGGLKTKSGVMLGLGETEQEVCEAIGADKLIYQDLEDLIAAVQKGNPEILHFDTSCFSHEYITGDVDDAYLERIEALRNDAVRGGKNAENFIIEMQSW